MTLHWMMACCSPDVDHVLGHVEQLRGAGPQVAAVLLDCDAEAVDHVDVHLQAYPISRSAYIAVTTSFQLGVDYIVCVTARCSSAGGTYWVDPAAA